MPVANSKRSAAMRMRDMRGVAAEFVEAIKRLRVEETDDRISRMAQLFGWLSASLTEEERAQVEQWLAAGGARITGREPA